ncbi:TPA: hypothetical protein DCG61_02915 [Patescibacteria group bacterium]|jgi:hypothetical protein|nr:hypothetical protein [Patescibacteria group bacterium]
MKFTIILSILAPAGYRGNMGYYHEHSFRAFTPSSARTKAKKYIDDFRSNEAKMAGGRIISCKLYLNLPVISKFFGLSLVQPEV